VNRDSSMNGPRAAFDSTGPSAAIGGPVATGKYYTRSQRLESVSKRLSSGLPIPRPIGVCYEIRTRNLFRSFITRCGLAAYEREPVGVLG
jgi:hypothetical protein